MGDVNFYLKKADESGKSLIYLQYRYNGRKLVFSFGQNIDPANWKRSKQRVKSNAETTADGKHSLNDLLDNLANVCEKAYNTEIKNGIPEPSTLKRHLVDFINQNKGKDDGPTLYSLIERFKAGEIQSNGKEKSSGSLQNYHAVLQHLKSFERDTRYSVNFDSINLDFFYKYTIYLKKEKKLSPNTIAKDVRLLKVFLSEAVDLGYTDNLQFKHKKFSMPGEETDAVYLTDKEIMALYNYDFSGNRKLDNVRDLFVFGCFVGLRYSDYSEVKPDQIVTIDGDFFIKLITQKTKELVIIPCNPIVLKIFDKYAAHANKLPKSISNQKFNDYVKKVCKEAKLNEKGRLSTNPSKELWECVSSHTARRSFATNYYLEGFPTIDLMKITGHKTEKAFLNYIRVTKLDTAKRLSDHIKRNWSAKMMRVA